MFGAKKAKEIQEKIQKLEAVQERYLQLEEEIQHIRNDANEIFLVLDSETAQMEQGLSGVQDIINEEKEKTADIVQKIDTLVLSLKDISEDGEKIKARLAVFDEEFAEGKKAAFMLNETVELCAKAAEHTKLKQERDAGALTQPLEELDKMQENAKGMTNIALNAAIEAGRLGSAGLNFLQAAEEVRKLSEEYIKMADGLRGQIIKVQEQLADEELFLELSELLKKTREAADRVKVFEADQKVLESDLTDSLSVQQEALKDIQDALWQKDDSCQSMLGQMELIGQNHTKAKESMESFKEKLELFYGKELS